MIRYSFIVPVKAINAYIREAVPRTLAIARNDFEIIIYPDISTDEQWPRTRQVPTGAVGPAVKRSRAVHEARGEILVFIDDDAYPELDLLDRLDEDFRDPTIVAVGGPAITPPHDTFWQRISGAVFLSRAAGGFPERYAPVGRKRSIDDWPSVNLSVRRDAFTAVGGFNVDFWPGEDTKLCLDLTRAGGMILYDPAAIVWHHRREGLRRHLRQVGRYGLHRGYFAHAYPKTSRRWRYFLPSTFLAFIILGGIASALVPAVAQWYFAGWVVYLAALAVAAVNIRRHGERLAVALHATYYIFLTHLVYGSRFLQGLVTRNLQSTFRS